MSEAPERLWAWSFNTWDKWGGYARPNNRHPIGDKERETGAEYIRADIACAIPDVQPKVKQLVWEDVMMDRGDGYSEPSGDYEALCAWGSYYIEIGLGSNSYYWYVETMGREVGNIFDDLDDAKAAAQADYEARILSALEPAVQPDAAAIKSAAFEIAVLMEIHAATSSTTKAKAEDIERGIRALIDIPRKDISHE